MKKPPRKRWGLRIGVGFLIILILFVAGVTPLFQPVSGEHHPVTVRIPPGANVMRIGEKLQASGVIRSAYAFVVYTRWKQETGKLKAGRYQLSGDMTLAQISAELQAGSGIGDRIRVTIPEGYTLKQIADKLEELGVIDSEPFNAAATDANAISQIHADFPLPEKTLEGYLFPDTYGFLPHTPAPRLLETMLLNFYTRFYRPYQSEIEASGRSLHELVTLASVIEREAKVPEDRSRIAGVLDNRLKKGMKLEVDATVLYALGHHKDRVLYKDLAIKSPYNTYRVKGLPPGPIANPGLPSLLAALHPEKNDFLYYVARSDGAHIFSRTFAEHEEAKQRVRRERQPE